MVTLASDFSLISVETQVSRRSFSSRSSSDMALSSSIMSGLSFFLDFFLSLPSLLAFLLSVSAAISTGFSLDLGAMVLDYFDVSGCVPAEYLFLVVSQNVGSVVLVERCTILLLL